MKKRIICLLLALLMVLSLSSCIIGEKYDYDMTKFIQLPTISGSEIEVKLDSIQATIDSDILDLVAGAQNPDKITAAEGDDVKMVITIKELYWVDDGNGKKMDQSQVKDENGVVIKPENVLFTTDDATTDKVVETLLIKDLGSGNFHPDIEKKFLKKKLGQSSTEIFTLPSDLTPLKNLLTNDQYEKISAYAGKDCYLTYKFISRPVREGDIIQVTYTGYYMDDAGNIKLDKDGKEEKFDGGSGTSFVYVGAHLFIEDFEKGVCGMNIDEEGQFKATFPEDYHSEDLKGKTVIFKATVKSIFPATKYDLNFIKTNISDKYTSVEEYEKELVETAAFQQALDKLVTGCTVLDYPRSEYKLIERQLEQLEYQFAIQYQMTFDDYLKNYLGFTSRDAYIKYTMQMEMAYYAYAQANGILPTDGDIADARANLIADYKAEYMASSSKITEAEALELATSFVDDELEDYEIYQEALYALVGDHLKTQYTIKKTPSTYTSVSKGGSLFEKAE